MWRLSTGFGAAQATALPPDDAFHGYPALPETMPAWVRTLPYVHARAPTAAGAGEEVAVRIALDPPAAVLSLEAGRAIVPAGKAVAVRVDTAPMTGLTGPLRLDVTGLPAGVHAEFSPPQVAAGETATLTLTADATAPAASAACLLELASGQAAWSVDFGVDVLAAPAVVLQGPAPGDVLAGVARVEVSAAASPGMKVAEVRLLVDGAQVAAATGSPASFSWNTAEVPDGAHDLSAVAVDQIGNSGTTAPVRVAVRNGSRAGGCASAHAEQPLIVLAAALCALLRRRRLS
jgi:hypothetical protein